MYAFEVSHTTDIARDATVLLDLTPIAERVFIVAPDNKRSEFENSKDQLNLDLKSGKEH